MKRAAAIVLSAAWVAGCSLQPVYQRPPSPVAPAYPSGPAYKPLSQSVASTPPAADIGWRDFLLDSHLQRLVEIALANNRDLRVAVLNVAQARAQYRIQRAALFPQVGATAQSASSRTPASLTASGRPAIAHDYFVGLSVAWEIDLFGRVQSLKDQVLQQYFATAEARKAFEILLVSQVADQYLTMLAFDDQLRTTQETLDAALALSRLTLLQFQVGTASELSLRQAESVVEQARANHTAQLRGRAQAENALVLLLGQPLPSDLPPSVPLGSQAILADVPAGLPSELLTRRPDVMQAEAALRGANANIGAARAAFFPTIGLTGNLGTASSSLGGLFKPGSRAWDFVPSVSMPVFEAGRLQANLDLATLQKDIDVAQYEKAIQTAFREVADGLAARGTYDDELASIARLVSAQQRSLDLAELQFRNGVADYLAVLTAQTGLYAAQTTQISTRLARLTSLVDLYRVLGGGWLAHSGDAPRAADADGATQ